MHKMSQIDICTNSTFLLYRKSSVQLLQTTLIFLYIMCTLWNNNLLNFVSLFITICVNATSYNLPIKLQFYILMYYTHVLAIKWFQSICNPVFKMASISEKFVLYAWYIAFVQYVFTQHRFNFRPVKICLFSL